MRFYKKWLLWLMPAGLIFLMLPINGMAQYTLQIKQSFHLQNYPSASALEWHKKHLWVAGDDAYFVLVLDENFEEAARVYLFGNQEGRIAKKDKADLEASCLITLNGTTSLMLIGSASKVENRREVRLQPLEDRPPFCIKPLQIISTHPFFEGLSPKKIKDINIEGAAICGERLILANRGLKAKGGNLLLITDPEFWNSNPDQTIFTKLELPDAEAGISGLSYDAMNNRLFFTASSENTTNSIDDGEIGDSYLGWFNNMHEKLSRHKLKPDGWIKLAAISSLFQKQKIESVSIESESPLQTSLTLCADNDDGTSRLFQVQINWHP